MTEDSSKSGDWVIRIPKEAFTKEGKDKPKYLPNVSHDVLKKTGVIVVDGEHLLQADKIIQTLALPSQKKREAVIRLFDNPALYSSFAELCEYIHELGMDSDEEIRFFAALSVAELSNCFPFSELNESIIEKWATAEKSSGARDSAAFALTSILEDGDHKTDVLELLSKWSKDSRNRRLVSTAVTSYYQFSDEYPDEALQAVKNIVLLKNTSFLLPMTSQLLAKVYEQYRVKTLSELYRWFTAEEDDNLHFFAALGFLNNADINAFETDEECLKAADFIFSLWENRLKKERAFIQQLTTKTVRGWAECTVKLQKDSKNRKKHQSFFNALEKKYAGTRRNRFRLNV